MRVLVQFLLLLCLMFSSVFAFSANQATSDKIQNDVDEVIDVIGQRPLIYFKNQMRNKEHDFYMRYSELTTNDDFRIRCSLEKNPAAHSIMTRVCKPQYLAKLYSEMTRRNVSIARHVDGTFTIDNTRDKALFEQQVKEKQQQALADVTMLVKRSPKLRATLGEYLKAKTLYLQKRQAHYGL